jgi:hypothetical protein
MRLLALEPLLRDVALPVWDAFRKLEGGARY